MGGRQLATPICFTATKAPEPRRVVAKELVVSLPALEGYTVVEFKGIVTAIASQAGRGAEGKVEAAMQTALAQIRRDASLQGANAVLGLQAAPFAASIGG